MSMYINLTGKMLLASLAAWGAGKAFESYSSNSPSNKIPSAEDLGLPEHLYDSLRSSIFTGDRAGFIRTLDGAGAPTNMEFRSNLWSVLGGK